MIVQVLELDLNDGPFANISRRQEFGESNALEESVNGPPFWIAPQPGHHTSQPAALTPELHAL